MTFMKKMEFYIKLVIFLIFEILAILQNLKFLKIFCQLEREMLLKPWGAPMKIFSDKDYTPLPLSFQI